MSGHAPSPTGNMGAAKAAREVFLVARALLIPRYASFAASLRYFRLFFMRRRFSPHSEMRPSIGKASLSYRPAHVFYES